MKKISITLLTALLLAGISSCVKEKYTTPAVANVDPNLTANATIADLKALYTSTVPVQITQDLIISAVVVGDDKSGNLYKELAIEDATGGITLSIVGSDLYTTMPIGRRLFIKVKNLYVVQYSGLFQLVAYVNGDGTFGGIPTSTEAQYIFPGKWGIQVAPIVTTIAGFNLNLQSELIEIDNVQFATADRNQPYANATNLLSVAHTIQDCGGRTSTVYTSGYANFASGLTPSGNGKMLCIYSVYNSSIQLTIRDTTDISFTGPTCP